MDKRTKIVVGVVMTLVLVVTLAQVTKAQNALQGEGMWLSAGLVEKFLAVLGQVSGQPVAPTEELNVGGGTRFVNGLSTDTTSPSAGEVRTTTLTVTSSAALTGTVTVTDGLQLNNIVQTGGAYLATTTSGAGNTIGDDDFSVYDYFAVTPGDLAEGSDMTYTLAASSTWDGTLLDSPGDRLLNDVCFFMTATTSESQVILAAGTGVDLRFASSTSVGAATVPVPSLGIKTGEEACIAFRRQPDPNDTSALGDITAEIRILDEND